MATETFSNIQPVAQEETFSDVKPVTDTQEAAPEPSLYNKVSGALDKLWKSTPAGNVGEVAGHIRDWATQRAETNRKENLEAAANGKPLPHSEVANTTLGMLGSTANTAQGAVSPKSLAIAGGALVAPEIVGPALVAHGLYGAGTNAKEALAGNPESQEAALGGLAEATGGGALTAGAFAGGAGNTATGRLVNQLPSRARAGANFNAVRDVVGEHPVLMTDKLSNSVSDLKDLIDTGASTPQVINKFVTRIADTDQPPLTYNEARNFYSNASKLSASEKMASNPQMKRAIGQFTSNLNSAISDTAEAGGKLQQFQDAMQEYAKASKWNERSAAVQEYLKEHAIKTAITGLGLGAAGEAGRELYNRVAGK